MNKSDGFLDRQRQIPQTARSLLWTQRTIARSSSTEFIVDSAELEIGGKYYSQDDDATFDLDSLNTFPMQPGDSGSTVLAFDIPKHAAVNALSAGEVMFPDSPDDEIDFSTKLYAIKLAGPTSEGGQETASTPSPSATPEPAPAGGASSI